MRNSAGPELIPRLRLEVLETVELSVVVRRIMGRTSLIEVLSEEIEKRWFDEETSLSLSLSEASGSVERCKAPKKGLLCVSAGVKGFVEV